MKKLNILMVTAAAMFAGIGTSQAEESRTIRLFDEVVFYDGYMSNDKNPDLDKQDGILRHLTSSYAVRLTDEQMDSFGEEVKMQVFVKACCDNYDRIGNVNIAFVPKGAETYDQYSVQRIELGRFITPFMNKNKKPDTVPYSYDINYLSEIMHDSRMRAEYDYWLEFEIFGVPYAAQQQVAGCAGRTDVFAGTLEFVTSEPAAENSDNEVLVPIVMKKSEDKGGNFNNYREGCTDEIGKTIKTWTFEVPEDVEDAQIMLVTSNHGANSGGEEYNRRNHIVRFDGDIVLTYKPGRTSCEPFRQYNTQPNGIYGSTAKSDEAWQSFSNWCPGDVIDNRIISLGAVSKGEHSVKISVTRAKFADQQGDIPVSMFFQGVKKGKLPVAGIDEVTAAREFSSKVTVDGRTVKVDGGDELFFVTIYDISGAQMMEQRGGGEISVAGYTPGVYIVNVEYTTGLNEAHKIVVR